MLRNLDGLKGQLLAIAKQDCAQKPIISSFERNIKIYDNENMSDQSKKGRKQLMPMKMQHQFIKEKKQESCYNILNKYVCLPPLKAQTINRDGGSIENLAFDALENAKSLRILYGNKRRYQLPTIPQKELIKSKDSCDKHQCMYQNGTSNARVSYNKNNGSKNRKISNINDKN